MAVETQGIIKRFGAAVAVDGVSTCAYLAGLLVFDPLPPRRLARDMPCLPFAWRIDFRPQKARYDAGIVLP